VTSLAVTLAVTLARERAQMETRPVRLASFAHTVRHGCGVRA